MIYRLICIFLSVLISNSLLAQKGDLFLTHHKLDIEGLDNTNFDIKINSHGELCIANRSGLLLYDGFNWDYISTPSSALSIEYDSDDNLYVGCVGDFGKIDLLDNKLQFVSLNPNKSDEGVYFKTVYKDSSIYFLSEENILRYNIAQKRSNIFYNRDEDEYFTNLFEVDGDVLVQTNDSLYHYVNDTIAPYNWEKPEGADFVFFDKHPDKNQYVVGTTDNKAYIYENKVFTECKVNDFLDHNESFIENGRWLNSRYFALSTLENGCILFDNDKQRIVEVINQSKGLPDNEIQAIGVDHEEGLWISHQFGLTRMEISIPFRSFTNFQGLHGTISEAFFYRKKLYVATSEGVYHLDRQNVYKNTVYYTEVKSKQEPIKTPTQTKKPKRSSSRKGKKSQKQEANDATSSSSSTHPPKAVTRRVRKEVIESRYMFKPIKGIHSKTEKFIIYRNKLLAAGTNGVYEIKGDHAELVIHAPVRFITPERKTNRLIIGTLYNEIKLYELHDKVWTESEDLNLHGELVMTAFNDRSGRTWFVTPTALMEFHEFSADHLTYNTYKYRNQFIDDTKLTYIDRQLYLINSEGYFYLHTGLKEMVEDTVLMQQIGKPIKHLQQRNGIIWVFNGENWFMINKDKSIVQQDVFGLFPNMTYVSKYGSRHWLVNDSREILQYEPAISDSLINENKVFYRKVTSNKGDVKITDNMSFAYDENSILFELSKPDYRGILKPEYQHRLSGNQQQEWSPWSSNNTIPFNLLPHDNYTLEVRSRDSFGNIEDGRTVKFVIHPPFWKELWFYGLEIIFMAGLVITSIVINRRTKTKYVLVTEGLTILTIVMVIEFLQTVFGSYVVQSSPIVDFGIDVVIALFVFPIEQVLKKYMKADKKGNGMKGKGLFDFLSSKKKPKEKKGQESSSKKNLKPPTPQEKKKK
ncbi:MAG: hypothetical protein JXR07_02210 [Reichenbachiella sp.]